MTIEEALTEQEMPISETQSTRNNKLEVEKRRGLYLFWSVLAIFILVIIGWLLYHLQLITTEENNKNLAWIGLYIKPPRLWGDWFYASLAGVLIYALCNIAYWYHQRQPRFVDFSFWYISTIVKGPVVAIFILLFLTNVAIEISGLNIDFSQIGAEVLFVIAFILGFYSRVAREQLNLIVKGLFSKAYSSSEETFTLIPQRTQVIFGRTLRFQTSRLVDVTWIAALGKVENGLYTAPVKEGLKSGQEDQIVAIPKDPDVPRATALITLRTFEIVGRREIIFGKTETYMVAPQKDVSWKVVPKIGEFDIDDQGSYTAPPSEKAAGIQKVNIMAISTKDSEDIATLEVFFKES